MEDWKLEEASLDLIPYWNIVNLDPQFNSCSKIKNQGRTVFFYFERKQEKFALDAYRDSFTLSYDSETTEITSINHFAKFINSLLPQSILDRCKRENYDELLKDSEYINWLKENRGSIAAKNLGLI